jgi:tRNA pseudouridine38-40 synthase
METNRLEVRQRDKYKIKLQYVGTRYHGWQAQKDLLTVQAVVSDCLSRLDGDHVSVIGASRTDAGVHALGQVAHFQFHPRPSIPDLQRTLNAVLPWDIRIMELENAHRRFHARWHATHKRYDYRIYNGSILPPFLYQRVHHEPQPLDASAMGKAARLLEGTQDFSAFAATSSRVSNSVRTLLRSTVIQRRDEIVYRVVGTGFLHHMVRNIVGTLLEVGLGQRAPEDVQGILEGKDRTQAGPTAPPEGLYLVRIWYDRRWSQRS